MSADLATLTKLFRFCIVVDNDLRRRREHPVFQFSTARRSRECPTCGSIISEIDVSATQLVGIKYANRKWPDIIQSETLKTWLVSDQIVEDMKQAGLTGYQLKPFSFSRKRGNRDSKCYWLILPTGECKMTAVYPDGSPFAKCGECRSAIRGQPFFIGREKMQALSTIVEPNCDISDFGKGVWPSGVKTSYCSDRVVDLAREKKWEDVHFGTFLGLPPWWLDLLEPDLYKCVNWRELLVYGIAKCYRGIMDVYDHELGPGHIPDYMLQYADEVQDVLSRPRPVPDYGDAAVVPPHPFDSMSFVDGEWHYGHVTCGTMPEEGAVELADRAEHGEEARPPKKYRLLFDAFLKGEGAIVDAVDAIVREGLARLGRTGFADHRPGVLGPFGTAIAHYSLEIGRPRPGGGGYLTLVYLVPFDPPPNAMIEARVFCDAQGRLSIVSAMVVLPDGTEEKLSRVPKSAFQSRAMCAARTSASASPSSRRSREGS